MRGLLDCGGIELEMKSKNRSISFVYTVAFFFLIKPDYFSYMGVFTLLYNVGFLMTVAVITLCFIKRSKISKTATLVLGIALFPFMVSLFEGVAIANSIIIPLVQTIGLAFLMEMGVHKRFGECVDSLALILEIYTYINFFSIIFCPSGLYEADFYSGNYWFLGYKNVMIRFLLPGICVNAINTIFKKGVYTFRLCCLIAISVISLWITDNKTGFIGLLFVSIMLLLFSRKQLPRFINLRSGAIVAVVISILLATTSIVTAFSSILESLGETISVMSRQAVWIRAIELFIESPIFGYGLRTNDGYRTLINLSTGWGYFSHPHNYILFTLIQGGIISILLIISLFIRISRRYRRNNDNYGLKVLICMYLSFLIIGMTEALSGATLLYPLAILADGFIENEVKYDYQAGKCKRIRHIKFGGCDI